MNRLYIIAIGGLVSLGVLGVEKASAGGMGGRSFQGGPVRGFGPSMGGIGGRSFQGGAVRGFGPSIGAGYRAATFTNTPRAHMPSSPQGLRHGFARPGSPGRPGSPASQDSAPGGGSGDSIRGGGVGLSSAGAGYYGTASYSPTSYAANNYDAAGDAQGCVLARIKRRTTDGGYRWVMVEQC